MAAEELAKEAAASKARAEIGGASEWGKKRKRINKTFVGNTILQIEGQNQRADKPRQEKQTKH